MGRYDGLEWLIFCLESRWVVVRNIFILVLIREAGGIFLSFGSLCR